MHASLEQVCRKEYGRIIATLIRISGSFDLAEEKLFINIADGQIADLKVADADLEFVNIIEKGKTLFTAPVGAVKTGRSEKEELK